MSAVLAFVLAALLPIGGGPSDVTPDPADGLAPMIAVVIVVDQGTAVVGWLPGDQLPETFRVYGDGAGASQLLAEVAGDAGAWSALVPPGFASYRVVAVDEGDEVGSTRAMMAPRPSQACLLVETTPSPGVTVGDCMPWVAARHPDFPRDGAGLV